MSAHLYPLFASFGDGVKNSNGRGVAGGLSDDLALITGSGTWADISGQRFMPIGMTYTLRQSEQGWRIVTAVIHGADAA